MGWGEVSLERMYTRELTHAEPGYVELHKTAPQSAATWAGAGEWPTLLAGELMIPFRIASLDSN